MIEQPLPRGVFEGGGGRMGRDLVREDARGRETSEGERRRSLMAASCECCWKGLAQPGTSAR